METPRTHDAPLPRSRVRSVLLLAVALGIAYLLVRRGVLTAQSVIVFAVLIPSVILHEVSHGAAALAFGDDTAQRAGRLTLNPVSHVDPFGTIVVPALLVLTTGSAFGWAKPVPVNPRRLRRPRNQSVVVSLVGPGVNVALALVAALAVRMSGAEDGLVYDVMVAVGVVNVVLAAFNLIPIPPLDGSAVVERLLPGRWWPAYLALRQYSMVVLVVVVLLLAEPLRELVFDPAIRLWAHLL